MWNSFHSILHIGTASKKGFIYLTPKLLFIDDWRVIGLIALFWALMCFELIALCDRGQSLDIIWLIVSGDGARYLFGASKEIENKGSKIVVVHQLTKPG